MFEELITKFFMLCVYALQVIGGSPGEYGFGYYLANILIFVVLQPSLILIFFVLWRLEKRKNKSENTSEVVGRNWIDRLKTLQLKALLTKSIQTLLLIGGLLSLCVTLWLTWQVLYSDFVDDESISDYCRGSLEGGRDKSYDDCMDQTYRSVPIIQILTVVLIPIMSIISAVSLWFGTRVFKKIND